MKSLKMLVMSLTGECNLRCRYCYAAAQDRSFMTWETARRAIDITAASGEPLVLQLSGGEPLLAFPLLRHLTEYIRKNKLSVTMQIQTNGTLITEEIAEFFQTADFGIGVSFDGRAAVNDQQRQFLDGNGASAAIAAGIGRLSVRRIGIGLTCVITAENVMALDGLVEMAYYFGNVRRIGFDLLRTQGRGREMEAASAEAVRAGFEKALARADELASLTGYSIHFTQVEQVAALASGRRTGFSHCHAMNGQSAHVDAQGNFYVCSSFVGDPQFYLGNVYDGIDERKQQETADFIRRNMQSCMDCEDFAACGGACFARTYGVGGCSDTECALKRAAIKRG
jgi:uncharacterized protein